MHPFPALIKKIDLENFFYYMKKRKSCTMNHSIPKHSHMPHILCMYQYFSAWQHNFYKMLKQLCKPVFLSLQSVMLSLPYFTLVLFSKWSPKRKHAFSTACGTDRLPNLHWCKQMCTVYKINYNIIKSRILSTKNPYIFALSFCFYLNVCSLVLSFLVCIVHLQKE